MSIRIMPQDPDWARRALELQQQREAEKAAEATQRQLEVQEAIANNDVVRMATLWLDRRGHLVSDRCAESVRDMNLLTPELAHAADDAGLPCNWMLPVRDLKGSSSLFTAGPMITLLARAAHQIENLRFAEEAKQRAASRRAQAPASATHPTAASPPSPNSVAGSAPTNTSKSDAADRDGGNPVVDAHDNPHPAAANPEQVKPRGRLLLSWDEILDVLGLPKARKEEARIKRLNEKHSGPIDYVGNKPKVFSEVLLRWIDRLGEKAQGADEGDTDADLELNHPGEMKKLGFQEKERPNNPGASAQQSGYEES